MNQRKLLLITLTAVVGACVFYSYTLNKKVRYLMEKVLNLENEVHTLLNATPNLIQMKIQERDGTENVVSDDNEDDLEEAEDEAIPQNETLLLNNFANTANNVNVIQQQLQNLQQQMLSQSMIDDDGEETEDDGGEETEDDGGEETEDDGEEETKDDSGELEEVVEVPAGEVEVVQHGEGGSDDDSDVEYIIEYETETEDEGEENTCNENNIEKINEKTVEDYIDSISQKHTKNTLIGILKSHDLSTFGNKDTLVKRIMTLDNFQKYL